MELCNACHGGDGRLVRENIIAPSLNGQHKAYMVKVAKKVLKDHFPSTTGMQSMFGFMSPDYIAEVLKYYSLLEPPNPSLAEANPSQLNAGEKVAELYCKECHGMDGEAIQVMRNTPHLLGQSREYIMQAIEEFQSGRRKHRTMSGAARDLTDQEAKDVATYYAAGVRPKGTGIR